MFETVELTEILRVGVSSLQGKIREALQYKLSQQLEGKCSRYGYIRTGSVQIDKISPGTIRQASLNGDVVYAILFKADVFNPLPGTCVSATVKGMNRFGILASVLHDQEEVMNIIITRQSTIESNAQVMAALKVGSEVNVEVIARKYGANDQVITAIGRVQADSEESCAETKNNKTQGGGDTFNESDADEDDDIDGVGDDDDAKESVMESNGEDDESILDEEEEEELADDASSVDSVEENSVYESEIAYEDDMNVPSDIDEDQYSTQEDD
jgi:DNA-directed RNA polymerase subunit E'/Rpb7